MRHSNEPQPPAVATQLIACVIYAAKSTQDVRGSLVTQVADCRHAIETVGAREIVGEYQDEAVSGYHQSRGEGLENAMRLASNLAREHGTAELWVQHSDRLARGDGKTARHVVEIALWALKADVTVRSVQDPDTFRDLLYAVVTGQRNHEDSKRKGAATAAGRRRAAERGEFCGRYLDGYRQVVEVDTSGTVRKRMEIDPARRPLFELIFKRALDGKLPRKIAGEVNKAGWRTASTPKSPCSTLFSANRVRKIIGHPRYAGLATYRGEVVGAGQWPGYITPRQHERLTKKSRTRTRRENSPHVPFLLERVAVCGACGVPMFTVSAGHRADGTAIRRYACSRRQTGGRCPVPRLDEKLVDALFAANLEQLLPQLASTPTPRAAAPDVSELEAAIPVIAVLQHQIHAALARQDHAQAKARLDELLEHRQRATADTRRAHAVRLAEPEWPDGAMPLELNELRRWTADMLAGKPRDPAHAKHLNLAVRSWFARIELRCDHRTLTITAHPRHSVWGASAQPATVQGDIASWRAAHPTIGYCRRDWTNRQIEQAIRTWTRKHGQPPQHKDWPFLTAEHPSNVTVGKHYGPWNNALKAAGLPTYPERAGGRKRSRGPAAR